MKYTCERCLKEFTQKSNFDVHMNRKNPCQILKQEDNTSEICFTQKSSKNPQNYSKILKITQKSSKSLENFSNNNTSYNCEFCNKSYSRSDNFKRHQLQFCKAKRINEFNKNLSEQNKIILEENNLLKEKLNKFEKLIKTNSLKKINNITKNNTTNTNNGQIYNNTNTNNINIKMVSFGKLNNKNIYNNDLNNVKYLTLFRSLLYIFLLLRQPC
jgi:hypothetical protein